MGQDQNQAGQQARETETQETGPRSEVESLEAEQESAAAMDSDVPQPPGAEETTGGSPS